MVLFFTHKMVLSLFIISKERWGLSRNGSSQGALGEGEEREGGFWLMGGAKVNVIAYFTNSCQCQSMHLSLILEGQSCVHHSWCILANLVNLMVLACLAKCGHCVRRSERGMALGMMSLQSNYLTHTW